MRSNYMNVGGRLGRSSTNELADEMEVAGAHPVQRRAVDPGLRLGLERRRVAGGRLSRNQCFSNLTKRSTCGVEFGKPVMDVVTKRNRVLQATDQCPASQPVATLFRKVSERDQVLPEHHVLQRFSYVARVRRRSDDRPQKLRVLGQRDVGMPLRELSWMDA